MTLSRPAPDPALRFAAFCGEMAESLSFNRSVGQIYGLLYVSSTPLSLSEIARRLSMSKGNASINLRSLETWGAVRPVSVPGSRQDHYEANGDLKALALTRVREGVGKRLDLAEKHLEQWGSANGVSDDMKKKVQDMRALVSKGRKAVQILPKLAGFL